jgi:hypothetical protein
MPHLQAAIVCESLLYKVHKKLTHLQMIVAEVQNGRM